MIRCKKCAYWQCTDTRDSMEMGLCRKYAPKPTTDPEKMCLDNLVGNTFWPKTHPDDMCGEGVS